MSTVTTDPIADMLSRIRNAIAVNKQQVSLPHSKIKESVALLLKEHNFITDVKVIDASIGKSLQLTVIPEGGNARITELQRMSKPGRRHYAGAHDIPVVKRGRGLIVVSTSKGLMTGDQAKAAGLGGELICSVY